MNHAKLVHQVRDEKVADHLTQDDFSFNQVLSLIRQTAIKLSRDKAYSIKRKDFIQEVNRVLEEEGGLTVIKFLKPSAITGRYPWIKSHLQTFLHRHHDVARRSLKYPDKLRILTRKPVTKLNPKIHRPRIV